MPLEKSTPINLVPRLLSHEDATLARKIGAAVYVPYEGSYRAALIHYIMPAGKGRSARGVAYVRLLGTHTGLDAKIQDLRWPKENAE